MIVFSKVSKKFKDGTLALNDVSFTIDKGEFVFLVGPSGAGKTTISRLLIREIAPTSGRIFVDNKEITNLKEKNFPQLRREIGVAFQDFKLFPNRTVAENISLPLEIAGFSSKEIKERIRKVLLLVGLLGKENFFPSQLSGGEIQRVTIARAIVSGPKILFADEPTGNLDLETAWGIIILLKKINEAGTTVIVATHNFNIIEALNYRIIELKEGKIVSQKLKEKKGKDEEKKEKKRLKKTKEKEKNNG